MIPFEQTGVVVRCGRKSGKLRVGLKYEHVGLRTDGAVRRIVERADMFIGTDKGSTYKYFVKNYKIFFNYAVLLRYKFGRTLIGFTKPYEKKVPVHGRKIFLSVFLKK